MLWQRARSKSVRTVVYKLRIGRLAAWRIYLSGLTLTFFVVFNALEIKFTY